MHKLGVNSKEREKKKKNQTSVKHDLKQAG
jgi:hypothetical protein